MTITLIILVSAGLSLSMMGASAVQRRLGNAGWVDVVWTFGLGAAGLAYALAPAPDVSWPGARQLMVAALVALWSLRLGLHLARRTAQGAEDARYTALRREWGADFERRLFWFLQAQAAGAALLAPSMLLAARNPRPLGWNDLAALLVLAIAIAGEGLADAELQRFRRQAHAQGGICERGLWRWSRHPNYFFEWLGWCAYPLFAIDPSGSYPSGWLALSGPLIVYGLLVHVSGIPPLERQMLQTRGEAYRAYQRRTRPFLPLPPWRTS